MSRILIDDLIGQFHEIYDGSLWLDETIYKKLKAVDETMAFERPLPKSVRT